MTRYLLMIELPGDAKLELSTLHPQPIEDCGQLAKGVDNHSSRIVPIRPIASDGLGRSDRLGVSAPPAAQGEPRDLSSLSEDELIRAHGGITD